ncbi:MAG TPA: APC family permease [Pseudonocardiaceae bacterium]|jgi:amino acid transporter|nr:APC family permease [Pseudonocardiaceae bacterium]
MTQTSNGNNQSGGSGQLQRRVGVTGLTFISLGSIIGSGWLLGALTAASSAGGASIISWVLAGVILVLLALVHAELASAYPVVGGTARFPRLAFGAITGFTAGWVAWLQAVTLAPIEVLASLGYLNHKWSGLVHANGTLTPLGIGISAVLMLLFSAINILGVRWLSDTNTVTVVWKIAVPVITVITLIVVAHHFSNFTAGGGFAPYGAHGIFAALPLGVVFALQGFEQAAQLGGEARNPQRDLPRAIIGAVLIGTLIYLALEVAFVGSLNPADLIRGWANPVGKGDFGPYATLATSLGLGWLAVILYIDAFISPAGTGLVYLGTSARLSYALGHSGSIPKRFATLSARGVPWVSILLSFVVGMVCFLPFPSWKVLVGFITSATVIMYAFAPITLTALRKSDPERPRPYRLSGAVIISPLSFVAANEIIYWAGWETNYKLLISIVAGFVIFGLSYLFGRPVERPPLDPKSLFWMVPWLAGLGVISWLGQYGSGLAVIPDWVDLGVVAVWSLLVFYVAVAMALPSNRVAAALEQEKAELESAPELTTA